jgi:hypothetical protein
MDNLKTFLAFYHQASEGEKALIDRTLNAVDMSIAGLMSTVIDMEEQAKEQTKMTTAEILETALRFARDTGEFRRQQYEEQFPPEVNGWDTYRALQTLIGSNIVVRVSRGLYRAA